MLKCKCLLLGRNLNNTYEKPCLEYNNPTDSHLGDFISQQGRYTHTQISVQSCSFIRYYLKPLSFLNLHRLHCVNKCMSYHRWSHVWNLQTKPTRNIQVRDGREAQWLEFSNQMLMVKSDWWHMFIFSTSPVEESTEALPSAHLPNEESTSINRTVKSRFCTVMWPPAGHIHLSAARDFYKKCFGFIFRLKLKYILSGWPERKNHSTHVLLEISIKSTDAIWKSNPETITLNDLLIALLI